MCWEECEGEDGTPLLQQYRAAQLELTICTALIAAASSLAITLVQVTSGSLPSFTLGDSFKLLER